MATIKPVRAALAAQIQAGTNITTLPKMPAVITPPMIMIIPGSPPIQYGQTMGEQVDAFEAVLGPVSSTLSKNSLMLTVLIAISIAQGYEPMQDTLDALIEPAGNAGSVPDVIALDPTLGGVAEFAVALDVTGYGIISIAAQDYFGAHLRVQVGA